MIDLDDEKVELEIWGNPTTKTLHVFADQNDEHSCCGSSTVVMCSEFFATPREANARYKWCSACRAFFDDALSPFDSTPDMQTDGGMVRMRFPDGRVFTVHKDDTGLAQAAGAEWVS